ncbi:MAG: hypothetical protein ACR2NN_24925 [Bryobacteraceae bacterium]
MRVILSDISVSPSGTYAVAATALSGGGAPVAFIAWLDPAGKTTRLVQLSPTAALRLSFADDGTLWALVRVHDEVFNEVPDYDMLRHYDSSGLLLNTALPRKHFRNHRFPAYVGILTTLGSRVALYAEGARTWVELSSTGEILGHWTFPSPPAGQKLQVTTAYLPGPAKS